MKTDHKPGPWGYHCRGCGKLALAFVGGFRPAGDTLLEDMDICQRGPYPTKRRSNITCQHCQRSVPTNNGLVVDEKVVLVDDFIERYDKQEARRLFKIGRGAFRNRPVVNREHMGVHYLDDEEPDEPVQEAPEEEEGEAPLAEKEGSDSAAARFEQNHPVDGGESARKAKAALGGKGEITKKAPSRPKPKVKKREPDAEDLNEALG